MDRFPRSDSIVQARSGLQTYMAQVYGWMTCGLLLTAFIAWYAANTPAVMMFVFSSKITFFGLIIAQLALVFVLSGMVQRLSAGMATTLFMLYSALTGLTLSSIFIVYTYSSIASTFVVTGGMFGIMSLYGYTTKRDLVARRFFLHKNAINFALSEGAKKTHSAQCKNERKECLLMLLLSRITFVESRQADSIFESYITM